MSDSVTRLNAALEGRYRIERELGEGGMATVYLADDIKHERNVALKVLSPSLRSQSRRRAPRDVKPGNILPGERCEPLAADWRRPPNDGTPRSFVGRVWA